MQNIGESITSPSVVPHYTLSLHAAIGGEVLALGVGVFVFVVVLSLPPLRGVSRVSTPWIASVVLVAVVVSWIIFRPFVPRPSVSFFESSAREDASSIIIVIFLLLFPDVEILLSLRTAGVFFVFGILDVLLNVNVAQIWMKVTGDSFLVGVGTSALLQDVIAQVSVPSLVSLQVDGLDILGHPPFGRRHVQVLARILQLFSSVLFLLDLERRSLPLKVFLCTLILWDQPLLHIRLSLRCLNLPILLLTLTRSLHAKHSNHKENRENGSPCSQQQRDYCLREIHCGVAASIDFNQKGKIVACGRNCANQSQGNEEEEAAHRAALWLQAVATTFAHP